MRLKKQVHLEGMANQNANLGNIAEQRQDFPEARRVWALSRDSFAKLGATPMVDKVQGWLDGLPK